MPVMITRFLDKHVRSALRQVPAVAILGPRQCGKTTLARKLVGNLSEVLYLDLERPSDLAKLADPELYLSGFSNKIVILDEVQRVPGLFPVFPRVRVIPCPRQSPRRACAIFSSPLYDPCLSNVTVVTAAIPRSVMTLMSVFSTVCCPDMLFFMF